MLGKEEFIEGNEIDIDRIQNQFNGDQHGDHIPARKESVHADEEERRGHEEIVG